MEDLGIDIYNMDQGAAELYPPLNCRAGNAGPISHQELVCIHKVQDISKRFHASGYFLPHKEAQVDIKRYSDKYKTAGSRMTVLECINAMGSIKDSYFSEELLDGLTGKIVRKRDPANNGRANINNSMRGSASSSVHDNHDVTSSSHMIKRRRSNSHTANTLEHLSRQERRVEGTGDVDHEGKGKPRTGSIDSAGSVEEEEAEVDDDYVVDHYESDGGGDDDDDPEPFY